MRMNTLLTPHPFVTIYPPRPDSACARLDTPPIHFVAGGEMTPPELAEFQNENEKENENEYYFVSLSLHPFIPSSPYSLLDD